MTRCVTRSVDSVLINEVIPQVGARARPRSYIRAVYFAEMKCSHEKVKINFGVSLMIKETPRAQRVVE